jgi:Protein of unknown function (DUF2637)
MTGDRVIRVATAAVVTAVASFAAVVSFSHIYDLGRAHGQAGTAARLLPLSVDGLILAASLVLLHEARNRRPAPALARFALWLGIAATLGANAAFGAPFGPLGVVVSTWPAVSFVLAVEVALGLVRRGRPTVTETLSVTAAGDVPETIFRTPPGRVPSSPFTDAETAAAEALARSIGGGNPLTPNALAGKFRLTRAETTRVVGAVTAASNGHPTG